MLPGGWAGAVGVGPMICIHQIPEDQCLHCLTPALRVAIDALAQARAEVARLKDKNAMLRDDALQLRDDCERLRIECSGLRKDADRYRFLRDGCELRASSIGLGDDDLDDDLDVAIDDALEIDAALAAGDKKWT